MCLACRFDSYHDWLYIFTVLTSAWVSYSDAHVNRRGMKLWWMYSKMDKETALVISVYWGLASGLYIFIVLTSVCSFAIYTPAWNLFYFSFLKIKNFCLWISWVKNRCGKYRFLSTKSKANLLLIFLDLDHGFILHHLCVSSESFQWFNILYCMI